MILMKMQITAPHTRAFGFPRRDSLSFDARIGLASNRAPIAVAGFVNAAGLLKFIMSRYLSLGWMTTSYIVCVSSGGAFGAGTLCGKTRSHRQWCQLASAPFLLVFLLIAALSTMFTSLLGIIVGEVV